MGFTWKSKAKKRYAKHGPFTVRREERFARPDRIEKVTVHLFGKTRTIWER